MSFAFHTVWDGPWPQGTTVAVWPASAVSGGVPSGAELDTAVAQPDGSATFGGLTLGEDYVAFGHGGSQAFTAASATVEAVAALQATLAAVEANVTALQGRNLSGAGSPEGVVTASPGATYQQTNGAEGATHWVKETGTGNTGWRLSRRIFPFEITLFGPESRAAEALQAEIATGYSAFPGSAFTASTSEMLSGLNARIRSAYWNLVWTPNAVGCGVQLLKMDAGATNIEQIAEFTGNAAVTPVNLTVNVTTAMQAIVDFCAATVPTGANNKTIAYRTKGDGAVGPLIYANRVFILFEA